MPLAVVAVVHPPSCQVVLKPANSKAGNLGPHVLHGLALHCQFHMKHWDSNPEHADMSTVTHHKLSNTQMSNEHFTDFINKTRQLPTKPGNSKTDLSLYTSLYMHTLQSETLQI